MRPNYLLTNYMRRTRKPAQATDGTWLTDTHLIACERRHATVKRLPINRTGRDFVVGDIHGHFDALENQLAELRFDPATDRLIATGDLIDRGPQSERALEFLGRPWFHSVRGNHEQMMLDWLNARGTGAENLTRLMAFHFVNGGRWITTMDHDQADAWADRLNALPFAIEIERPAGTVGMVHAEIPVGWTWEQTSQRVSRGRVRQHLLWARRRALKIDRPDTQGFFRVEGVQALLAGHNARAAVTRRGDCVLLDTGSGFQGGRLTVLPLDAALALPYGHGVIVPQDNQGEEDSDPQPHPPDRPHPAP